MFLLCSPVHTYSDSVFGLQKQGFFFSYTLQTVIFENGGLLNSCGQMKSKVFDDFRGGILIFWCEEERTHKKMT